MNMDENLCDLIIEMMKNARIPSNHFVIEAFNQIVKANDMYAYANKIEFKNLKNAYGEYISSNRTIYINLPKILKLFQEKESSFYYNIDLDKYYLAMYLITLKVILHECNHVLYLKKATEKKDKSLETQILNATCKYEILINYWEKQSLKMKIAMFLNNQLQNIYYEFSPEERLASIDSYEKCLRVISILDFKESECFYKWQLYYTYLQTYERIKSPTIYYLHKLGFQRLADDLKQKSDFLDLDTRLRLGLALTKKEKNELQTFRRILINKEEF